MKVPAKYLLFCSLLNTTIAASARAEIEPLVKCPNFAGSWQGSCTTINSSGEHSEEKKVVIKQKNCEQITFDEETLTLGIHQYRSQKNLPDAHKNFESHHTYFGYWVQNSLHLLHSLSNSTLNSPANASFFLMQAEELFQLQDGKLISQSDLDARYKLDDSDSLLSQRLSQRETCTYLKSTTEPLP